MKTAYTPTTTTSTRRNRTRLAAAAIATLFHASPAGSFCSPRPVTCRACLQTAASTSTATFSRPSSERRWARSIWGGRERGWGGRGEGTNRKHGVLLLMSSTDIESPFATPGVAGNEMEEDDIDAVLPLTLENVEKVLDEMRPYLMSDG